MKIRFAFISIFLLSLVTAYGQTGFVQVKGSNLVGPDGRPFLPVGTNLGNWLVPEGYMFKLGNTSSPRLIQTLLNELIGPDESALFWKQYLENFITRKDIRYLKTLGMNSIRIPFHYKIFTDEEYLGGKGEARGFRLLDSVIGYCRQEGIYVILDMHCAPGGQTGDNIDDSWGYPYLFEGKESRNIFLKTWKKIAAHYRNEKAVIGYDLLNEPIAHYFDTARLNPLLEPLYKEVSRVIREVDNNHILFIGGAQWDSNFSIFGPPFDNKLVYTFHKYWTSPTVEVIRPYIEFRDKYQVPLYCGETGENSDEWVGRFRILLDSAGIGWHFWPYKKMDNKAGILRFNVPEGYDKIVNYADSARQWFADIRKNRPSDTKAILKSLMGFLENCKFENCIPNSGYIRALGFNAVPQ